MTEISDDLKKQLMAQAQAQLDHLKAAHQAHVSSTGMKAAAAPSAAPIAVSGQATFALAFIYGVMTFNPIEISPNYKADPIWGVGLSGGTSFVVGVIDKPSNGDRWDVNVNNTPGIVTGLNINFFRGGMPVGSVVGPALSGGIGMIAGGAGSWS